MKDDEDDLVTALEDASSEETARAKSFARLVDRFVDGEAPPPALEADERALLDTATAISASLGRPALGEDRRERVLDRVFSSAQEMPAPSSVSHKQTNAQDFHPEDLSPRSRRTLPWVIAAVASAAALWLAFRPVDPTPAAPNDSYATRPTPASERSRPSDRLIGRITRAKEADASQRIDAIYADRLAAYRAQRLSQFQIGDLK